ncbi:hypothetical protein ACQQCD_06395 [Pseudarthrobacter sp. J1763]|uniref:hypothetical protein n=1 Tax=Pseudarthrobacter sp. J1763 TaxID=3420445 RepID=UPI003D276D50
MNPSYRIQALRRLALRSPRSGASIVLALVLLVLILWFVVSQILLWTGSGALVMKPSVALENLLKLPAVLSPTGIVAAAVGAGILGLLLLWLALSPGNGGKRALNSERSAVVVDDQVIASAVARTASLAGNLGQDQIHTTVDRRSARVQVRPTSGVRVDAGQIQDAVSSEINRYGLNTPLDARVTINESGALGQ